MIEHRINRALKENARSEVLKLSHEIALPHESYFIAKPVRTKALISAINGVLREV